MFSFFLNIFFASFSFFFSFITSKYNALKKSDFTWWVNIVLAYETAMCLGEDWFDLLDRAPISKEKTEINKIKYNKNQAPPASQTSFYQIFSLYIY